jgi:pimeloyl-ACP methyl ester carboxylesterase
VAVAVPATIRAPASALNDADGTRERVAIVAVLVEDRPRRVTLEVRVEGAGPDVVLVPSAMRGAADFAALQAALTAAGYRSIALNPRRAGNSTGAIDGITLRDLADDVALVVTEVGNGRAHLVGHALGNILVRATASYRPDVVRTVTVMPCGGHDLESRPVSPAVVAAMARCHDSALSEAERLAALRLAFFAGASDPRPWLDGWWPASGGIAAAARRSPPDEWWRAGTVPMLIVQPLEDAMATPESGREAAAALGDRVTYVEVPQCGHAILPEQPAVVAGHVIRFLDAHT